uniref:Transposase n=1 Tax=Panagrellus redivivus TaxID=6233 RepID=A0A7E4V0F9_PANRE
MGSARIGQGGRKVTFFSGYNGLGKVDFGGGDYPMAVKRPKSEPARLQHLSWLMAVVMGLTKCFKAFHLHLMTEDYAPLSPVSTTSKHRNQQTPPPHLCKV